MNAPTDGASWGSERTVRAEVIAKLLLGARETEAGTVPAVRLRGARITGPLVLRAGNVGFELVLSGCHLDEPVDFNSGVTRTIRLTDCSMPGFNGGGMRVSGHLSLSGSSIHGTVRLARAQFDSGLWMGGTKVVADDEWALYTASLVVDSGTFLRNADFTGGVRLVGARLNGGLFLDGATLRNPGKVALNGESMVVEDVLSCTEGFTSQGCVRLRGARINGTFSMEGVIRSEDTKYALHCSHMEAREVYLKPAEPIAGAVSFAHAHVNTLHDDPSTWPDKLHLNGLTYDRLRGSGFARRIEWVARDPFGFLPQPYEQLAAWYMRDGNDALARRTQLAKLRARRRSQSVGGRALGGFLDVTVGYGYRPWLASIWFALLLAAGTAAFTAVPPRALKPAESPGFDAFAYSFDLLLPIPAFGQRDLFDPGGWTQWLAYALIVSGWLLATALIAGATRVLRPS
ncbi:hypothetical protein ACIBG8_27060 [Nonomuraea sp. NPDC050556]|uniref:hypothetical protein n=1 Tax=Nonomuraea sp. NPDC050556 TaxID=3364369 RepID=UPI0037B08BB4